MSADLKSKKRKSGDNIAQPAKKVKTTTTVAKSADKPAPLKSALKKAVVEKTVKEKIKEKKEKKVKPAKKVDPEPEPEVEEEQDEISLAVDNDEEGGATLSADQTAALLAGFSSDESDEEVEEEGIDVSKLPAAPTTGEVQKAISKSAKAKQAAEDDENTPGVIYISRLPHGFFEKQLRAYFSQFGTITHLRLARNKKTGKSRHYAFVEFEAASVADIVAKTMDKYLLFGHVLQCKRVPQEQVKETMWKGPKGVKGAGKVRPRNRIEGSRLRKGMGKEGWEKRVAKEEKRRLDKAEQLKELRYEFEMPGVKGVDEVKTKVIEAAEEGVAKLIENGEEQIIEETVVAAVESGPKGKAVIAEKTTKRKTKAGGEKTVTATKKRKTKA